MRSSATSDSQSSSEADIKSPPAKARKKMSPDASHVQSATAGAHKSSTANTRALCVHEKTNSAIDTDKKIRLLEDRFYGLHNELKTVKAIQSEMDVQHEVLKDRVDVLQALVHLWSQSQIKEDRLAARKQLFLSGWTMPDGNGIWQQSGAGLLDNRQEQIRHNTLSWIFSAIRKHDPPFVEPATCNTFPLPKSGGKGRISSKTKLSFPEVKDAETFKSFMVWHGKRRGIWTRLEDDNSESSRIYVEACQEIVSHKRHRSSRYTVQIPFLKPHSPQKDPVPINFKPALSLKCNAMSSASKTIFAGKMGYGSYGAHSSS